MFKHHIQTKLLMRRHPFFVTGHVTKHEICDISQPNQLHVYAGDKKKWHRFSSFILILHVYILYMC